MLKQKGYHILTSLSVSTTASTNHKHVSSVVTGNVNQDTRKEQNHKVGIKMFTSPHEEMLTPHHCTM